MRSRWLGQLGVVRGGLPEQIAMKVTGHRTRSMFARYNIASLEDKRGALKRARVYAASRLAVGSNLTPIASRTRTQTSTRRGICEEDGGSVWESNPNDQKFQVIETPIPS